MCDYIIEPKMSYRWQNIRWKSIQHLLLVKMQIKKKEKPLNLYKNPYTLSCKNQQYD